MKPPVREVPLYKPLELAPVPQVAHKATKLIEPEESTQQHPAIVKLKEFTKKRFSV
jgi:hypothetical protein